MELKGTSMGQKRFDDNVHSKLVAESVKMLRVHL